ncbi:MAG: four helix bundle suffix domain-containing protein [Bacteroidaceae bacterium]|nr:four helix bundle suffix domain-containing protein [Bacteroidaceae bacterium]
MPAHHFLRRQANWEELYFYKKTVVLYQLTFAFTKRFLKVGDRTVDQMVQAARSGKQNIVEGFADGVSSTEMEIKLLNVARASIKELKEDYEDYLTARNISKWDDRHPRFATMLEYCRQHNNQEDYNDMYSKATDEELANLAITLCRQVDKMMTTYLAQLEQAFIEEDGIKERMTAARLGRRQTQNETIEAQAHEIELLKKRIQYLEEELKRYRDQ